MAHEPPAESQDQLKTIIDSIPILAWTARADGAADFFNRRWLDYTGLTEQQALNWGWAEAIHPDDRSRVMTHWRNTLASEEPYEIEARMRRFDAEHRWFLIRATPQRDSAGNILKWYGTNTEIEDRKRAEHALGESEKTFRLISDIDDLKRAQRASRSIERDLRLLIDNVPGLVFTTKPTGEVEFVNRRLLDYFGRTLEELQAWQQADAVHPTDLPHTIAAWSRGIELGQPVDLDQRLRRHDGVYCWFHFRAEPRFDADGRLIRWYGLLTNIDDLMRADEALRITQARLSRATHLATVSQLSASIAHEINQPLAAIVSNGHACHRWLSSEPPNIKRALLSAERIVRDGNSSAEVIRRIRSLFSHAPLLEEVLNLNAVIEEVCSLIAEELRTTGVALKTDLPDNLPEVSVDRVQILQVIANLTRNGIEAMQCVTGRPKELLISTRHDDDEVAVHVADGGPGISDPLTVFEPFYTTKATGMGMGLAICRSIIEAHGGRIWAINNTPHGARFGFALRVATATPRPAPE